MKESNARTKNNMTINIAFKLTVYYLRILQITTLSIPIALKIGFMNYGGTCTDWNIYSTHKHHITPKELKAIVKNSHLIYLQFFEIILLICVICTCFHVLCEHLFSNALS